MALVFVRGLYRHGALLLIVRECSGFLPSAVTTLNDGVPDREQVDCERGRKKVGEKKKETNTKRQQTPAQTCDIMDGMWME